MASIDFSGMLVEELSPFRIRSELLFTIKSSHEFAFDTCIEALAIILLTPVIFPKMSFPK